ncbi:lipoyl(octanoyl) transferase LipB [Sinanaerobacter chloroacetimidivorans]|jgi:lipoyl(octanoyl) transferase|uniref:Octanoyltransferase n=1 Tax=Sinanaerobacter chloroacetimidivorans TaxID=2818044 RepID=A0A8J7W7Y9_9FIRM|nr:lipoyl(octanoyl) transferase LipB [Sinanaerobacter chloroacetimidivorans]MBR0600601.1 lipoyl(octanoyl) transferase LipB [Sinanaerobacter chloroacetimidivorans]
MGTNKLTTVKLGLMGYEEALALQMKIQKLVSLNRLSHILLILEHPPVITMGSGAKLENILADPEFLKEKGIEIFKTGRGGDVTYHGPGQIVGYPILNLNELGKDVKAYVRKLEEVTIRLLKSEYGIDAGRNSGFTGVWVGNEKITAIGCSVKRWVTMHGFAFNVNTDMEGFALIHPCGIIDKGVTSLKNIMGVTQDMQKNMDLVIDFFGKTFHLECEAMDLQIFLNKIKELTYECEQTGLA